MTGCRVPALTTSPVVSLVAARPRPSSPLGGKEGGLGSAEAAGVGDPTHGLCYPSSQACALGARPRRTDSALFGLGKGAPRIPSAYHPG